MTEPIDNQIVELLREHEFSDLSDTRLYMMLLTSIEGETVERNRAIAAAEELNERYDF